MIYVNGVMLILSLLLIIVCSIYGRHRFTNFREKYHVKGIYVLLYPTAWMIYVYWFRKKKSEKISELRLLYPLQNPEHIYEEQCMKNISNAIAVFIIFNALSLVICISHMSDSMLKEGYLLERNSVGNGSKEVELYARYAGDREKIYLTVDEKRLDERSVEALKPEWEAYIRNQLTGSNNSLDEVYEDLNFISDIPGYSVKLRWATDDYSVVGMDGSIKNEELSDCRNVAVTAVCNYFDDEWEYIFNIRVYPQKLTESESRSRFLSEELSEMAVKTAEEDYMTLPDTVSGERIVWEEKKESSTVLLSILGIVFAILIFVGEGERYSKLKGLRQQELSADYPIFVHKMVLLLGTGMNAKTAWLRIVSDYDRHLKEGGSKRYVYEEMKVAVNEMNQGITEVAAYENFGKRCGLGQYLKFSSILIQSVKTGAKGMGRMLMDAGDEAALLRREYAKRLGEEAGTKLLFPMVILLGVVMVVLMVPAFMTMNW